MNIILGNPEGRLVRVQRIHGRYKFLCELLLPCFIFFMVENERPSITKKKHDAFIFKGMLWI